MGYNATVPVSICTERPRFPMKTPFAIANYYV
jgi:hypothetical protein